MGETFEDRYEKSELKVNKIIAGTDERGFSFEKFLEMQKANLTEFCSKRNRVLGRLTKTLETHKVLKFWNNNNSKKK